MLDITSKLTNYLKFYSVGRCIFTENDVLCGFLPFWFYKIGPRKSDLRGGLSLLDLLCQSACYA